MVNLSTDSVGKFCTKSTKRVSSLTVSPADKRFHVTDEVASS